MTASDEARVLELAREWNEIELRRWAQAEVAADPGWAQRIAEELLRALKERK